MRDLAKRIEALRTQLERHRRAGLKEYPTRTIFIDPLLEALGWDVRDPDEVELEYPTIDGKSVDYALKINRKPVLLLEAKQLKDSLDDVKAITQVVGYAANDGIEWCVLTNGVRYKVYRASERAAAPDKLLFEVSLDPLETESLSTDQVASQVGRFSRDSLAHGILDQLGEEIFTTSKVRKALDQLFSDVPDPLLRSIRRTIANDTITPMQIRQALARIWRSGLSIPVARGSERAPQQHAQPTHKRARDRGYTETHHIEGKPQEVVELYRGLDRFCQDLSPGQVSRRYLAKYVSWSLDKWAFCSVHIQQSGLRLWVKMHPTEIPKSTVFARDVSKVGHWGVGDVELAINSMQRLRDAEEFIRASFERAPSR